MNAHDTLFSSQDPAEVHPSCDPPTVLVVGTGAVGGFYGARLARAGARVSTVHRSDFDIVHQHGIHIDSIDGDFHFMPHQVLRQVNDCTVPPDYLLVTLKALPDIQIPQIIRPAVGPKTVIILLQNGIDNEEPVARAFPHNEIISALAFICVQRSTPGVIRHLCFGRLVIGLYPQGTSESVQRLAQLFATDNVPCRVTESPVTARWAKLVWNASFNPISVLSGNVTTQQIMEIPEIVDLIRNIMYEVMNVAGAAGYSLPDTTIEDNLEATRQMLPYHTSMSLDFMQGRPLESEAILGAAIRAGDRLGIPTPCLDGLYALLKLLDAQRKHP
ncbi:MAG: 2-dehydropantoate 2-reductase [Magnetococcus sp. YQC-5]